MDKKPSYKWNLVRRDRITGSEFIVGKFMVEGDALWAATVFEAHKVIGSRYQSFITNGKQISYPSSMLPDNTFFITE